ncbi:MAG TPA: twin-arginine translocase TatA/TatE family subunit [Leptolinea sp.]
MIGELGTPELLIILVIIILLFGVGRISKIAGELGKSVRYFREGLNEKVDEDANNVSKESDSNGSDSTKEP